jgi:FkbM family methyltransferase
LFEAVYAFEPDPALFRKAVILCGAKNVVWFNTAVGSRREMVHTECRRRDGSSRPAHEGLTFTVPGGITPTIRIDDLDLPRLDLLCLDIEGSELDALKGAARTIARHHPVMIVEVNKQSSDPDALRRHIIGSGYEFRFRNYSDEVFTCSS